MSKVRQVEELMIGNAYATETTSAAFVASATDKEIAVVGTDGGAVAAGEPFKVLQKTATGFEFSDRVEPGKVDRVTVKEYAAEVQKKVTVSGFTDANVIANHTYAVEIRIFNPHGAISTENFEVVTGYFVTGADVTNVTGADVLEGVAKSLEVNLTRRGNNEVTVTQSGTTMVIEGIEQVNVPGKDEGRQIKFMVTGKVFDNVALTSTNLGLLTAAVTVDGKPGAGTYKSISNKEWFTKGFKYDVYREAAYPADFNTPYYAEAGTGYNTVIIHYFAERSSLSVERQYKSLTIAVAKTDAASNAATNSVLDALTTAGVANVPADLAVV